MRRSRGIYPARLFLPLKQTVAKFAGRDGSLLVSKDHGGYEGGGGGGGQPLDQQEAQAEQLQCGKPACLCSEAEKSRQGSRRGGDQVKGGGGGGGHGEGGGGRAGDDRR